MLNLPKKKLDSKKQRFDVFHIVLIFVSLVFCVFYVLLGIETFGIIPTAFAFFVSGIVILFIYLLGRN